MSFINQHRERFGVEPICQTLEVAPSTYYAALSRPPSARRLRDKELKAEITRVHQENFDVYGVEKVWKQLRREIIDVGRDRVCRLMAELELEGVVRGKVWRTTIPEDASSLATSANPLEAADALATIALHWSATRLRFGQGTAQEGSLSTSDMALRGALPPRVFAPGAPPAT